MEHRTDVLAALTFGSDCKSRGFDVKQTQLKHPDRIERLLLALAVAMLFSRIYWNGRSTKTPRLKKSRKKPDFLVQKNPFPP
ncbi:MAG: hypothetical protein ABW189_04380 [Rickettsiales bacterium]